MQTYLFICSFQAHILTNKNEIQTDREGYRSFFLQMNVDEYLKRIEINRPTNGPDKDYLNRLHIAHLTHIPFETFDLIDLKQLDISLEESFNRMVRQQRGGVCCQMNGLFAWILRNLNYHVRLIPCTIFSLTTHCYQNVSAHVCLFVRLENDEQILCDVGSARDYLTPLFFRTDSIQYTGNGFFRIVTIDDGLYYQLEKGVFKQEQSISLPCVSPPRTHVVDIDPELIKWVTSYRFPVNFFERSIEIDDFKSACPFVLHSPSVILNHCSICHIHIRQASFIGAYSLMGKEFSEITYRNGVAHRTISSLADINDEELKELLKEKFDILIERKLELVSPQ